jgi:hypothetical protein
MEIHMTDSTVSVGNGPDGSKLLIIGDKQSGIKVVVVLPSASAKIVASGLTGLTLATSMPGNGRGENHG